MKILQYFISFSLIAFLFTGCATILNGYEDRVDLINAPDDIKIYSKEGVEIPISNRTTKKYSEESKKYEEKEIKTIKLRTNKEHILLIKVNNKEKLVEVYPRIQGTWFVLDIITGIFPAFIDAYTGNWNGFQPININF